MPQEYFDLVRLAEKEALLALDHAGSVVGGIQDADHAVPFLTNRERRALNRAERIIFKRAWKMRDAEGEDGRGG